MVAVAAFVLPGAVIAVLFMSRWSGEPGTGQALEGQGSGPAANEASAGGVLSAARALPPGLASGDAAASAASAPAGIDRVRRQGADGNQYPVDLDYLRARIPDNAYWRLGQPTQDPQVLRQRAEEEGRWNELYGRVQSNTASEEEVHRYYDHRRNVSEDYIEFAKLVLDEYGGELPERDRGMYELSIEMHRARLAEIPRQIDDALARKRAHDQRREQWRQGQ